MTPNLQHAFACLGSVRRDELTAWAPLHGSNLARSLRKGETLRALFALGSRSGQRFASGATTPPRRLLSIAARMTTAARAVFPERPLLILIMRRRA